MSSKLIGRINELARAAKVRSLTEVELAERDMLRAEYIKLFRCNLQGTLDNTYIVDGKGKKRKLERKNNSSTERS